MLTVMCLVLLAAATRWVWQDYVPYSRAAVPAVALCSATPLSTWGYNRELFEEHQHCLDETLILNTARNPYGALKLASGSDSVLRMPNGIDIYGVFAEYKVKSEISDNSYKVRIKLMPALWTQAASTRFPMDRCAQLISNCNCMDSVYKGPDASTQQRASS